MSQMNMIQAVRSALDVMMDKDPTVIILGQDVGYFGGVFRCTDGLQAKYGEHRVIDAPIAEGGIIGSAIGIGVNGLRPVAEIQFADYIYPGLDQIISELARLRYRSGGEFFSPVTVRAPCGGGIRGGQTHSQSPEALFTHLSGVKTVMPSNPYDAKGLLISAIESDDPVIFFEPKRIYNGPFDGDPDKPAVSWSNHPGGEVPDGYYSIPLGEAAVVEEGTELSIITYGTMVHVAQAAVHKAGVSADIIDVRSLVPLDVETLKKSVEKTGRCLVTHEASQVQRLRCGTGRNGAGGMLLAPAGADRTRRWLGNTLSARFRVGLFPRAGQDHRQHSQNHGVGMSEYIFNLPDLGEGLVEAEIAEWMVKVGDFVEEEDPIGAMLTDKAAVELSAPVAGRVVRLAGEVGDTIAVGAPMIVFETKDGQASEKTRGRATSRCCRKKPLQAKLHRAHRKNHRPARQQARFSPRLPFAGRPVKPASILAPSVAVGHVDGY